MRLHAESTLPFPRELVYATYRAHERAAGR